MLACKTRVECLRQPSYRDGTLPSAYHYTMYADLSSWMQRATASLPAIKELNPLVAVTADPRNVASFTDDELAGFKNGCVILCDVDTAAAIQIAERCHRLTVPVFLATSFGFSSFFFADLGSHSALITTVKSKAGGEAETTTVQKVIEFKSLQQALSTSWRDLKPKTTMPAVYPWIGASTEMRMCAACGLVCRVRVRSA